MTAKKEQQNIDDQLLLSAAKHTLDASVENIDQETLDRLAAIRMQAVAAASSRTKARSWHSSWFAPAGGFVTAAVLVVAVMLWTSASVNETAPVAVLEDLPILTDSENLEFYQDLEFYQWLALNEQTVS